MKRISEELLKLPSSNERGARSNLQEQPGNGHAPASEPTAWPTALPIGLPEVSPVALQEALPMAFDTVLPASAGSDLAAARAVNQKVFLCELEKRPGKCPNCGGWGDLFMRFVESGPFSSPPAHGILMFHEQGWYIVEDRSYLCPVCQSPQSLERRLWELSGLERNEREWRTDFLGGLKGKESAVSAANDLLKRLPRPTGWRLFYGSYGTGKSGLMKSIVAGCIRAGVSAHYTRAEAILQRVRATYSTGAYSGDENKSSENEAQALRAYLDTQVLAIDEIERTSDTNWAQATLMSLLDQRYNRRTIQATLIASNLSPEQLPTSLGYLESRLKDGLRIPVGGVDMRGRK